MIISEHLVQKDLYRTRDGYLNLDPICSVTKKMAEAAIDEKMDSYITQTIENFIEYSKKEEYVGRFSSAIIVAESWANGLIESRFFWDLWKDFKILIHENGWNQSILKSLVIYQLMTTPCQSSNLLTYLQRWLSDFGYQ